jgi:hypothetical protein
MIYVTFLFLVHERRADRWETHVDQKLKEIGKSIKSERVSQASHVDCFVHNIFDFDRRRAVIALYLYSSPLSYNKEVLYPARRTYKIAVRHAAPDLSWETAVKIFIAKRDT